MPFALVLVDDHVAGAQLLDIVARAADGDRPGMVEAMTDRRRARLRCPSISTGTISSPSIATMPCSGRTQRSDPVAPAHRLGPGKIGDDPPDRLGEHVRARPARPARSPRNSTPSRSSSCSRVSPVLRRNPSSACGGAEARGPFISSATASVAVRDVARDQHQPPRRRMGVDRARLQPRLARASANSRARSLRAFACIRAGISSRQEFEQEVGHQAAALPSTRRRPPSPGRGRGRYRPGARRRRSRRAPAAC